MANAIILHGLPEKDEYLDPANRSPSNSHWLPWLQKQLLVNGIKADTPEVLNAFNPDYLAFVKEVERFDINKDTILVGHSMGAGFWVRYLSENPNLKVGKVILVAPWLNTQKEVDTSFFDFEINPRLLEQVITMIVFNSKDDFREVQLSVNLLKDKITKLKVREFNGCGHFTRSDLGTDEFPELLKEVLQ